MANDRESSPPSADEAMPLKVLLSGGGTGGHIYPALAIADAVRERLPAAGVLFVGAAGKMEMRRVPAAGYDIVGVPVAGFQRSLDRRNLAFPLKLARGMTQALRVVGEFAPDVAVGTGGYASGPALAAAAARGVPCFLQEQNALAGVTNRLLGKVAKAVFTAYPEAAGQFGSATTIQTGNPLRGGLTAGALPPTPEARAHFGLDARTPTLLSFGGSLGAKTVNEAHAAMTDFWRAHPELQLVWQTGEGYFERFGRSETALLPNVSCVPYLERMDLAYGAADLVACRAGALSISELQLLGKPALLIPSPNVAGDHQTYNARAVERAGGAVLVPDDRQVATLTELLPGLLADGERLARLADGMRARATPGAAAQIANTLIEHVRARRARP